LLFHFSYLGSDCYPRTLTYQKQSYKTYPLVPETEDTLMFVTFGNKNKNFYLLCKRQLAYTNVLIGQYRLSAKWTIICASLLFKTTGTCRSDACGERFFSICGRGL